MSQSLPDNKARSTGIPSGEADKDMSAPGDGTLLSQPAERGPQTLQAASARIGTFHAFRIRNYRLLWLGNAFTSAAMWIQQTTIGWVAYDLTGSGSVLGGVNGVRLLPMLLVTPIAGVASDRISRNAIVAGSQVVLVIATFLLGVALWSGGIAVWHLFAFSMVAGAANAFNMPARQTLVFDVVPRHVIPNAVALSNLAFSVSRTLGPLLGGPLIVAFGAATNFFLQSLAYLGVMATVLLIPFAKKTEVAARKPSFFRDMAEGYSFALKDAQARLLILMSLVNPLLLIPLHLALLPIYAKTVFNGGASSLGLMLGAIGLGGSFGGVLTASLNNVDRRGLLQLAALSIYSLSQAAFSLVGAITGDLWLAVPFLVSAGAAESLFTTTNQTVVQLLAPEHLRGRVVGVLQTGPMVMPLGVLMGGVLADVAGAPAAGTGLSLMAFGVGLALLMFSPRMRNLRLSELGQRQMAH